MRDPRPMDDLELKTIVQRKVREATGYLASEITHERNTNLEYYLGRKMGNEVQGRSQVVSRDVMDTVEWIMPTLMGMFHGAENPVEFTPTGPEDEEVTEQATDYVNHIYNVDNDGFMITYSFIKDALIQKLGVVKMFVETEVREETHSFAGLSEDQVAMLLSDEAGMEVAAFEEYEADLDGMPVTLFDIEMTREVPERMIRVVNVPPEEFVIERRARSLDDAKFMAHRTEKTRSELIEEGYDAAIVNSLPAYTADEDNADEDNTRYDQEEYTDELQDSADFSTDMIDVTECVIYVDFDGDGKAERRKVITAGNEHIILLNEAFEDPLFVAFCPVPTPHTVWGMAVADLVRDIQEVKTHLWRGCLDSLNLSLDPDKVINPNAIGDYLDDWLAPRTPGRILRTNDIGAFRYDSRPWDGANALPMIDYLDKVREGRTGVSQASQGIDKDLLQQTTAGAFNIATTNAQQRVEMIARIFADTAFKALFRGLLKLTTTYQDKERVIRLRNEWVPVDPRSWNADMDVKINVGLGVGNKDQQMAYLVQILQQQKEALATPIGQRMVTPKHIYSTLEQMTKIAGFPSVDPFFRDPDGPEAMEEAAQAAQAGQQPDPMQMAAQIEMAKLMLDREEMLRKDDRERDKVDAETMLKADELRARYGAQVDVAVIRALMDRDREAMRQQAPQQAQPGVIPFGR